MDNNLVQLDSSVYTNIFIPTEGEITPTANKYRQQVSPRESERVSGRIFLDLNRKREAAMWPLTLTDVLKGEHVALRYGFAWIREAAMLTISLNGCVSVCRRLTSTTRS